MDLDMSDDNIFETSMDSDENILETNIGALENSFISAKSSTSCEQVFADGLITKSNFTSSELDFDTFSKFRDNDFTYMLPKSFLGKVSHMVPMPKIISDENKDPKIDFVVSLMNGDFLVLKEGFPLARCCIGFPAEQILIHPVMIHQELHLYFILSNNDKVTIVKLLDNELQVMKKYMNVIKYNIVPEDNHNETVLFNLKLYYNDSSHKLDIFKLYTDEIGEESLDNQAETFEQLKHDLRFTQDLLETKQKLLRKQIELKEEIFEDLVLSNNSSSSTKTYPIILKTIWVYICNQKLVIGFLFGNTTSDSIDDFDFMITSSNLDIVRYTTAIYSKHVRCMTQSTQDEGFDVFLGPYHINGEQWSRTSSIKPGENIFIAVLSPPRLNLHNHEVILHTVLHYTLSGDNLQTPTVDVTLNARQILGNDLVPKFMDPKISSQEIFSVLAASARIVELSIIPSNKEIICSMLSALETEMKFQSIKNQSEGWVIHLYPSMLQNGILLKLGFSENGEAKCTVAARSDDHLLLLIQAMYMNLPCGFAIISERTRLIQNEKLDSDKKLAAAKSLESEMLILRKILGEHGEKCPDDIDKCLVRCNNHVNNMIYQLIDQEDITDKIISQLTI